MKRKLRMGMVGGGLEAMMGPLHRQAANMTGMIELVCGAFGTTRQNSYDSGEAFVLPRERVYGTYREMLKKESRLAEGTRIDFVSIVTPNNMHYPVSMAALDAGFHILSEKPMTTNMDEALNLKRKLLGRERLFGVMHTATAYPMVREARARARAGAIGEIRKIVIEYPQGWLATRLETAGNKQAGWRMDPRRSGPGGCITDLGSMGIAVAEFISGIEVTEVCADLHTFIPGRPVDDDASVLLRFSNGARGVLWATQVAVGETNGLKVSLYGDRGGLVWNEVRAGELLMHRLNGPSEVIRASTAGLAAGNIGVHGWMPVGIGQGYLDACSTLYREFAEHLAGVLSDEIALDDPPHPYPTIDDGIRVVSFLEATVQNVGEEQPKWSPVLIQP